MKYDIKNLCIWKQDSYSLRKMTNNPVKELTDKGIIYPVYMAAVYLDMGIDELGLSVRSYNCLRRRGWSTIRDIIGAICDKQDLMSINNLGKTCADEIFIVLLNQHYDLLSVEEKKIYKKKYDELNMCIKSPTASFENEKTMGGLVMAATTKRKHSELYMALSLQYAKEGRKLRFPVFMSDRLMRASFEELELSPRAMNCLRRGGYNLVGDVIEDINTSEDLKKIRGMGTTTADEIMEKIFEFQYQIMQPEKRDKFIKRIQELNA